MAAGPVANFVLAIAIFATINVTSGKPQQGYWEDRGYDVDGWVGKSNGRDDKPTS